MNVVHAGAFRALAWLGLSVVVVALVSACSGSGGSSNSGGGQGKFSPHVETVIVPSAAGGGIDATARGFQSALQKSMGNPITVMNQPGGQTAVGATTLLSHGSDCSYMMINGLPQVLYTVDTEKLNFDYSDFYPVIGLTKDVDAIAVAASSKYKTLSDLIADAKSSPNKLHVGVSQLASPGYVSIYQLNQALGIKMSAVQFNGGGPAVDAMLGGQVQFAVTPLSNMLALGAKARILGVFQDAPAGSVPSINKELNVSLPPSLTYYGLWVTEKCHQNTSEYNALVQEVSAAANSADYRTAATKAGGYAITSAAELQTQAQQMQSTIQKLLAHDAELFSES